MGNRCDCLSSSKDEQAAMDEVHNPNTRIEARNVENSAASKQTPRKIPSSALKPISSARSDKSV